MQILRITDAMLPTERADQESFFVTVSDAEDFCADRFDCYRAAAKIQSLINARLLPTFRSGSETYLLKSDLAEFLPTLSVVSSIRPSSLFSENMDWDGTLSDNTRIDLPPDASVHPAFYAAVRNLMPSVSLTTIGDLEKECNVPYFSPVRIVSSSSDILRYAEEQQTRAASVDFSDSSDFARSAYYMGSKRNLSGFLVEAISRILDPSGVIVDLMCGSGAASKAFSKIWKTFASDNQVFCRLLATVQGGGFSRKRAEILLDILMRSARSHAVDLGARFTSFLELEDKIFHGDLDELLLKEYVEYVSTFPTYPHNTSIPWNPTAEVVERQQNPKLYPYCLFSSYFANVYFGLRQSVEIDSLRYAIDQIENDYDRQWALGALITTLSALGTTYAAHFAQPKLSVEELNLLNLSKIVEQRAYSITHEFSIRFMNLAQESETSPRIVETVPGPWHEALNRLQPLLNAESVLVYIDAPYKRDEYSRYYHVLETLVRYSYPASVGKGRMPAKKTIERPPSEFFTRVQSRLNSAFVDLICDVLGRGWSCAWSYADSGNADVVKVLDLVGETIRCEVKSFATPYQHKIQGRNRKDRKRMTGEVTEYLVLLSPVS